MRRMATKLFLPRLFLSSFLPQEKVAEFARLTPEQLLKETQKGAGPRRMSDWHADLIRYSASMKDVEEVRPEELELTPASLYML